MAKYAIIINGDTEARHVKNVDRALRVLEKEGCETFVASTSAPTAYADHYVEASKGNIEQMIADARAKMGEGDELVIYVTGHGDPDGFCLVDDCGTKGLIARLDGIPYGQRTVIMDQCYSGNFGRTFTDDPNTLFVSAGSADETTCCTDFAPFFWGEDVPDINRDGYVSFQERYAAVKDLGKMNISSQYIPTGGYKEKGRASFGDKAVTVNDRAELDAQLKKLGPGQRAIVLFSADFCPHCRKYEPKFEKMPLETKGQYLFIETKNEELAAEFGVTAYPTVVIFDPDGNHRAVADRDKILNEMGEFYLTSSERAALLIKRTADDEPKARANAANSIADLVIDWKSNLSKEEKHALTNRLLVMLNDVDAHVRWAAAAAIGQIAIQNPPKLEPDQVEEASAKLRAIFSAPDLPEDDTEYRVMLCAIDSYGCLAHLMSDSEAKRGAKALRNWFGCVDAATRKYAYETYQFLVNNDKLTGDDLSQGARAIPLEWEKRTKTNYELAQKFYDNIRKRCGDNNAPDARQATLPRELGSVTSKRTIGGLIALLDDPDPLVRTEATRAIGKAAEKLSWEQRAKVLLIFHQRMRTASAEEAQVTAEAYDGLMRMFDIHETFVEADALKNDIMSCPDGSNRDVMIARFCALLNKLTDMLGNYSNADIAGITSSARALRRWIDSPDPEVSDAAADSYIRLLDMMPPEETANEKAWLELVVMHKDSWFEPWVGDNYARAYDAI